jgi:hypothetical protein
MSEWISIWKNFKMERILFEWIIRKNSKSEQIYIAKEYLMDRISKLNEFLTERISIETNIKSEWIYNGTNLYWNKYQKWKGNKKM